MAARRETGTPNLANHLATTHPLTRPDQITRSVVEGSLHSDSVDGAVADEEPIAAGLEKARVTTPAYGARMGVPQAAAKSVPSCSFQILSSGWSRIPYLEVTEPATGRRKP